MELQSVRHHPVSLGVAAADVGLTVANVMWPQDGLIADTVHFGVDSSAAAVHGCAALLNVALGTQVHNTRGEGGKPYAGRATGEAMKAAGYAASACGLNPLYGAALVLTGTAITLGSGISG